MVLSLRLRTLGWPKSNPVATNNFILKKIKITFKYTNDYNRKILQYHNIYYYTKYKSYISKQISLFLFYT